MKLYSILLLLFIFGAVTGAINESGIFDIMIPSSDINVGEDEIADITEGVSNTGLNLVSMVSIILSFFRIFASALLAILTILPILGSWGVPLWLGAIIQTPVWLVELVGLYQFVTGYQLQGME